MGAVLRIAGWVLAALCLSFVMPLSAQPVSKEAIDSCRGYSNVAAAIMDKRQEGASMADLMGALSDMPEQPELAQLMVRMAYEERVQPTQEKKAQATAKFRDHIYVRCFDSLAAKEKAP